VSDIVHMGVSEAIKILSPGRAGWPGFHPRFEELFTVECGPPQLLPCIRIHESYFDLFLDILQEHGINVRQRERTIA